MKGSYFEKLNPREFRQIIEKYPVAYLPFGAYEWHGEALPFGTDMFRVRHVATQVARKMGGIVLPSVWGTDIEHQRKGKTLWGMETFALEPLDGNACMLSSSTFRKVVQEMLLSCRHMGFKQAVMLTGHAAVNQENILRQEAEKATKAKVISAIYVDFYSVYHPGAEKDQHGGAAEIAEILVLNPRLVKLNRFASDHRDQKTGLARSQMKDVSEFLGKKLLKEQIDGIVKIIRNRE